MSLILKDPLRELDHLGRIVSDMFNNPLDPESEAMVPIDMYEKGDNLYVEAELPNFAPEEVTVKVTKDQLFIKAVHLQESESKDSKYYAHEVKSSKLRRSIKLPKVVNVDEARAVANNGMVSITLPLSKPAKPRTVPVESSDTQNGLHSDQTASELRAEQLANEVMTDHEIFDPDNSTQVGITQDQREWNSENHPIPGD